MIKVTKVQRCGPELVYADWFYLWHRHTTTFTCISTPVSIDTCYPCR